MATHFLNPYNFIPLPVNKAGAYTDEDKHTGVIEYTITTRSPLFIPNTSNDRAFDPEAKEHVSYDFYSYTELVQGKNYEKEYHEPVIPGSELRGMLRSVYETLTDSCMGVFNEEKHAIMRINEAYKAALINRMENGEYRLVNAESCFYLPKNYDDKKSGPFYKRKDLPKEGAKVYCKAVKGKLMRRVYECTIKKDMNHPEEGYLVKGNSFPRKGCHIFIPGTNVITVLTSKDIKKFTEVLQAYTEENQYKHGYDEYWEQFKEFQKGKGECFFPVYYSVVPNGRDNMYYLAPASFTKEISNKSLKELVGSLIPCEKNTERCPGCDLFGMIGSNNEMAGASKIRFADARVMQSEDVASYYDDIVTLQALSYPRIGNVEFYLVRPNGADFWNYDYYTKEGEIFPYQATLRGRKFYWHQKDKILDKRIPKSKQNRTIRPVKSGITFQGKLFFEKISKKQLNQLLWILNGGNDAEQPKTGRIAYKLGSGKPLGLGSVELKVTKLSERRIRLEDNSISYTLEEDMPNIPMYDEVGFSENSKNDFMTIASLDAAEGKLVTYPIVQEQEGKPMAEGFRWFQKNHIGYDYEKKGVKPMPNKRVQMKRHYVLPVIQGVRTLPIFENDKNNSGQKKNYNNHSRNSNFKNNNFKNKNGYHK